MQDFQIRPATLDDVDIIVEIERKSFTPPWEREIFYTIAKKGGIFRVEEDLVIFMNVMAMDIAVIGYVVWEEDYSEERGHILNIAIIESERSKGYGIQLLQSTFKTMIKSGLGSCELEVRKNNSPARKLYEKVGMMAIDKIVEYYDDEDAIIYEIIFEQ